jgi:uncharacterized membrane protein YjjP (DUF1212 family)
MGEERTKQIDYILDFVVHLGRQMLESGANLERVNLSMSLICKRYNLREVSIFSLSSMLSVSARDTEGTVYSRQVNVGANGIHLNRLTQLNNLSYKVCNEKPDPEKLEDMLYEAMMVKSYPEKTVICGYVLALACLCRIFGGVWQDIVVVAVSTVILYFINRFLAKQKLNRIITNVACMFIGGWIALFFSYIKFAPNFLSIMITDAFYLIPGVPMVNAVRNILCGNEMNGIIELLKVVLEVFTIVLGLYLACFLYGAGLS